MHRFYIQLENNSSLSDLTASATTPYEPQRKSVILLQLSSYYASHKIPYVLDGWNFHHVYGNGCHLSVTQHLVAMFILQGWRSNGRQRESCTAYIDAHPSSPGVSLLDASVSYQP